MRNQYQAIQEEIYDGLQMAAGGEDEESDAGPDTPEDEKGAEQKDPKSDEEE